MSISTLPLSYCGNVHPANTFSELIQVLQSKTALVQQKTGSKIAAGLWLPDAITREIESKPQLLNEIQSTLQQHDLICYTLNAFPFGNFHSERVKEQVYLPDWTNPDRRDYTIRCARILATLLPEGVEGSVSTVPLGFKDLSGREGFLEECCDQLIETARLLDEIHDDTGRIIRLAIEPEPLCVLETTAEVVDFFVMLRERMNSQEVAEIVERHLGVCYDVCHQSVEFEDVAASIRTLQEHDIRINKVHITCAIELQNPATNEAGRTFLADFAEPRYLHQTFRAQSDKTESITDLTADFVKNPPADWFNAPCWRIHFHVPVHAENLGPLATTRPDLKLALAEIANLEYAPHLEVETYTWSVMPGENLPDPCEGLAREMNATQQLLADLESK
ncbi:metabolite traffic protein EboE [uncultured Rubinisphaera sp.]|uniref:metabolite traffic protein EboE n=2 Tax=Rubinisphaera TaxID=1649490 RepID=UPI0030DBF1AE